MRSAGSEFLSVATVLSVPLAIALAFPFGAFGFRATEEVRRPARTAFVKISPEAERRALMAVRASWREKVGGVRQLRANLLCPELPDDVRPSVLSIRDRSRLPAPPMALCERTPFLPSQKAPPPHPINGEPVAEPLAFPREELLKMN